MVSPTPGEPAGKSDLLASRRRLSDSGDAAEPDRHGELIDERHYSCSYARGRTPVDGLERAR